MLPELTLTASPAAPALARLHRMLQMAVAYASLFGIGGLLAIVLSKTFFLGADSAHHYAHVWYLSDQLYHHARLPLYVHSLESGDALTFPYAIAPWLVAAAMRPLFHDWTVTAAMVASFVLYGYAACRARPALRDPRLISLLYVNTFLIEALMSFQFAFMWSVVFFFLFVEAMDRRSWTWSAVWSILAITTHPFAGAVSIGAYGLYALVRKPGDVIPLAGVMIATALAVLPFAWYLSTSPVIEDTRRSYLIGTLKWMARYRGLVVVLPFMLSAGAPAFRQWYLVVFAVMALVFIPRIRHQDVNTFGIDRVSRPFYGEFISSAEFDRSARYRVLEPNDREDGAYQLLRNGALLSQDFMDQSQVRRWWDTPEQYTCFLGAKHVDVVLLEKDFPLKFNQNEDTRLRELEQQGKASVFYRDPAGRFTAYDVRNARQDGASITSCKL